MSTLQLDDILGRSSLEVVIDDYGYQGEGYVELADGWLSVPRAMPGERVRVDVEDETTGGRRVFGHVTEVLEAHHERRDPLCDKFERCRGCQVRHLSVAEELKFKRRTVREVIDKFADLSAGEQPEIETITPEPTRRGDAFRIRSRLTYQTSDDAYELGLVTPLRDDLVPMGECPALTAAARRLVDYVVGGLDDLDVVPPGVDELGTSDDPDPGIRHISVASPTFGRGLIEVQAGNCDDEEAFESLLELDSIGDLLELLGERLPEDVGLAICGADTRVSVEPPERVTLPFRDRTIQAGYDDWFPATLEPTRTLYDRVLEDFLELEGDKRYLDVGCGVGTLSLLAACEVDAVTGIDSNRHSVDAAELNAVRNDVDNARFLPSGWEKALRELVLDEQTFDIATINPMREPLGDRPLAYLDQLDLSQIVYLGPSPEAASKDIGALRSKGWQIHRLAAANVHPATYHTLLIADLHRDGEGLPE